MALQPGWPWSEGSQLQPSPLSSQLPQPPCDEVRQPPVSSLFELLLLSSQPPLPSLLPLPPPLPPLLPPHPLLPSPLPPLLTLPPELLPLTPPSVKSTPPPTELHVMPEGRVFTTTFVARSVAEVKPGSVISTFPPDFTATT